MKTFLKISKLSREVWDYNVVSQFKPLAPKALMMVLTYKCNSRCVMCNIWQLKPVGEMGLREWEVVIDDPCMKNVETVTISGGEAMLYPEYNQVAEMLVRKLPRLQRLILNTNGLSPVIVERKVEEIKKICRFGKIRVVVSVSIDGISADHDKIRGIKGSFRKVTETVRRLKNKGGVSLGLAAVLMKSNLKKYWQLRNWFKEQGLPYSFQLVGFHDTYVNNLESEKTLNFSDDQKEKLNLILDDLKSENNIMAYYWQDMKMMYGGRRRTTPCPFLKDEMVVDSLGDVYYCLSAKKIGNFLKEKRSVGEIYFDLKNIQRRKKMWQKECLKCNSGCDVARALAGDVKKFVWYRLTGRLS